ncbi:MAG: hypothetical protein ICV59_08380 [Thermoleophilia bacterium]|nr:hypothetical protein [Thermoleophilia bacterium]
MLQSFLRKEIFVLRKLALLTTASLLLVPAAALAKGKPAKPAKAGPKGVMYVLKGSLSAYTPANASTNGSITIAVDKANNHARSLRGSSLTFALTAQTKVRLDTDGTIADGERGLVKLKAPRKTDATALQAIPARQVIDQD